MATPMGKFTVSFTAGIVIQRFLNIPILPLFIIVVVCAAVLLILRRRTGHNSAIILSLTLCIITMSGAIVFAVRNPEVRHYPLPVKELRDVTVFGTVDKMELLHEGYMTVYVAADSIQHGAFVSREKCNVKCFTREDIPVALHKTYDLLEPGNKIALNGNYSRGREQRNPGEFDYAEMLREQGIAGVLHVKNTAHVYILDSRKDFFASLIFSMRKSIDEQIDKLFDEQAAGLAKGLLLGDKAEISDEMQTSFINAGVAHVLAVSGLNVFYVSFIIFLLLGRWSLITRHIGSGIGILIFWAMAGNSPPVLRAVLMAYVVTINVLANRDSSPLNTLFVSAGIILFFAPQDVFTPSFQLTFMGVLSLLVIYPVIKETVDAYLPDVLWLRRIVLLIALTFAAQLGTIPVTNYYFGKMSVTGLIANCFVVSAINFIMGAQIMALIVSTASNTLGVLLGSGCNLMTLWVYKLVKFFGAETYSYIAVARFGMIGIVTYYSVLAAFLFYLPRFKTLKSKLILIPLVVIALLVVQETARSTFLHNGRLQVISVDVGQGDASLILFPDNRTMLIDAGYADPAYDNGSRVLLPLMNFLGIKKIDYGVISHFDADHYKGFASLMKAGRMTNICLSPCSGDAQEVARFVAYANLSDVNVLMPEDTTWMVNDCVVHFLSGRTMPLLQYQTQNDKSLCVMLKYGEKKFFFTGDAQKEREEYLMQRFGSVLDCDVLKVTHHGSRFGTTDAFIKELSPDIATISVGVNNVYHHPGKDVIERLHNNNVTIYRTDKEGAVILECDGRNIRHVAWK
jgi:competence protein ComEC